MSRAQITDSRHGTSLALWHQGFRRWFQDSVLVPTLKEKSMVAHRAKYLWLWALVLLPAMAGFWWTISTAQAQAPFSINYGETKSGEVVDRLGDEWVFSGCMSDVVTITMQSPVFPSYLQLYGPVGRDSLAEAGVEGPNGAAMIGGFKLPESGPFTIIAA